MSFHSFQRSCEHGNGPQLRRASGAEMAEAELFFESLSLRTKHRPTAAHPIPHCNRVEVLNVHVEMHIAHMSSTRL